jgi:hypothetical protein
VWYPIDSTPTNTDTPKELQVSCPLAAQGEEVTGGGYVISNAGVNVPNVVVQRSYAVDQHTWLVRAVATSGTPAWGLTASRTASSSSAALAKRIRGGLPRDTP